MTGKLKRCDTVLTLNLIFINFMKNIKDLWKCKKLNHNLCMFSEKKVNKVGVFKI